MRVAPLKLDEVLKGVPEFDENAAAAARTRQGQLTKPIGSLGRLEDLSVQMAGISATRAPAATPATIVVAAASHGITEEGVSAYPAAVTSQMVLSFLEGKAAINVLARTVGANLVVVDAGIGHAEPTAADANPELFSFGFGCGTANFIDEPAIDPDRAQAIVEQGAGFAAHLHASGSRLICLGDMGIGNTTAAAAVTAVVIGAEPAQVTGRGTMVDDVTWQRKVDIVTTGIAKHQANPKDALEILSAFGGYETGFLCGCILGAAALRMAIILDGFPTTAAALLACLLCPRVGKFLIAGHQSVEPGHRLALQHLSLRPLLDLSMRLGEGTGAALAVPIVSAATRSLNEMATFAEAGVSTASQ